MNWPLLTQECSDAIRDAIQDAVNKKPKDLLEHVAQLLEDRSGWCPAAFEDHFEECRKRPRVYKLEDICPKNQDPLSWVPMRYNDDTIMFHLRQQTMEILHDILSVEAVEDIGALQYAMVAAFPELMYMRDSPEEVAAKQTVRAFYLACTESQDAMPMGLDDADPMQCFRCEALFVAVRAAGLMSSVAQSEHLLEALFVCCILLILGKHEGFVIRYGGGPQRPDLAILHAIEHDPEVLPSYRRLDDTYKQLVAAVLRAHFPLEALITAEVSPAHFARTKDQMGPIEGGTNFFGAVLLLEHLVHARNMVITDVDVDLVRLSFQCLVAVEKYGGQKAYELYLKSRAERHSWRLMKDDFLARATVRLCCLLGAEDVDAWNRMQAAVNSLPDAQRDVIRNELGRKDGIFEFPAFMLVGGTTFMTKACSNSAVGPQLGVHLLANIFAAAAQTYGKLSNYKIMRLNIGSAVTLASQYRPGGTPFEDTPLFMWDNGSGTMLLQIPGTDN